MQQSFPALPIDSSGAHWDVHLDVHPDMQPDMQPDMPWDMQPDWHTVRNERPTAMQFDDDFDYFLRRPAAMTPQPMSPAPARVTARLALHATDDRATQASGRSLPNAACGQAACAQAALFTR